MNNIKTTTAVSFIVVISSLLAFARDAYCAKIFGVGIDIDCFFVALTVVSFVFFIFDINTIKSLFMPTYQKLTDSGQSLDGSKFFNSSLKLMSIALFIVSIFIYGFGYWYVPIICPGFAPAEILLTTSMIKILSPLIFITSISNLLCAVCNAHGVFIRPVTTQLINNFLILLCLLCFGSLYITDLACAFVIAAVISFLMMLKCAFPYLHKKWVLSDKQVISVFMRESSFLLVLTMVEQVVVVLQKTICSELEDGSISSLSYALKLIIFPVTIFAVSVSMIFFPLFIKFVNVKDVYTEELEEYFNKGFLFIIYCLMPITIFYLMNSENIIYTLFSSRKFDTAAVDMTSSALFYYSFGIIFHGLMIYLNKIYFAHKKYKDFFKIGILCILIYVLLSWSCAQIFGHIGIAIATSIYTFLNVSILLYRIQKFSALRFPFTYLLKVTIVTGVSFLILLQIPRAFGLVNLISQALATAFVFYGSLFVLRDQNFIKMVGELVMLGKK